MSARDALRALLRRPPRIPLEVWERRHRRLVTLLTALIPPLGAFGLLRGYSPAHVLVDLVPPVSLALLARLHWLPRARSVTLAVGLMAACASFVHLSGGRTEAHFLYFVILGILALYDDWVPYGAAVAFVLGQHAIVGVLAPGAVYSGGAQAGSPWVLAGIHGSAVLAASVVASVAWRWKEADRAEVDARLRLSEQRFRLTFEAAPIGITLVSLEGRFLVVNPAMCAIVGYSADELTVTDFQAITHPDDLDADLALVQECLSGERDGYVMEKRYRRRDGSTVWVQLNVALARDAAGVPQHFVAQILDITERRQASVVQARFAAMVEHGSDLMSLVDADGRVLYASPAYLGVLGIDPAAEVGRRSEEDVHPEDRDAVTAARSSLAPGEVVTQRFRRRHASGTWRWLESTTTNRVDNPEIGAYVVNTHDVSEQVLAVERLEHQATHDVLTGLANRALLDERLAAARSAAERRGEVVAVLFVDVDRFKAVNDSYGHAVGDQLLVQIAARLRRTARLHDAIARVGGDEFVVVAIVPSTDEAQHLAARMQRAFAEPFALADGEMSVTASIGLAVSTELPEEVGILEAADTALYEAKEAGRNRWLAFQSPAPTPAA